MINKEIIEKLDLKHPAIWLATWFGCGLLKKAPGTWGTLGGLPFGIVIMSYGGWVPLLLAAIIVYGIGLWASKIFGEIVEEHDSGAIVIDEVVGIWVTLLPLTILSPLNIFLAFVLFRFFDIVKPWPVSWADKKLHNEHGVMLDDVLAGIYAAIILGGLNYAGLG